MVIVYLLPYDVRIDESVIKVSIYLRSVDTKVNTCLSSHSCVLASQWGVLPLPAASGVRFSRAPTATFLVPARAFAFARMFASARVFAFARLFIHFRLSFTQSIAFTVNRCVICLFCTNLLFSE